MPAMPAPNIRTSVLNSSLSSVFSEDQALNNHQNKNWMVLFFNGLAWYQTAQVLNKMTMKRRKERNIKRDGTCYPCKSLHKKNRTGTLTFTLAITMTACKLPYMRPLPLDFIIQLLWNIGQVYCCHRENICIIRFKLLKWVSTPILTMLLPITSRWKMFLKLIIAFNMNLFQIF